MFKEIFSGTLGAAALSVAMCLPLSLLINGTLLSFLLKAGCFVLLYGAFLLWFGLRKEEGEYVTHSLRRLLRKKSEK
jgi:hypothetical protein